MSYETLLYEVSDHIATVTLNRPDRLNAITRQLQEDLFNALNEADKDVDVRVIILTGAGRGFCAGADMKGLDETSNRDWSDVSDEEWVRENCKDHKMD